MIDLVMEFDAHGGRHLYEQIYDHIKEEERRRMERRQSVVMERLGIYR